jgi:hypothetical protein
MENTGIIRVKSVFFRVLPWPLGCLYGLYPLIKRHPGQNLQTSGTMASVIAAISRLSGIPTFR